VYPINLSLAGRRAVVIGAGSAAEHAVSGLLEAGADVTLIAISADPALVHLADQQRVRWLQRAYAPGDAAGAFLVVAASGNAALDGDIVADAKAAGVLVHDGSDPARGTFTIPAVHRSGQLIVAVASSDLAPSFVERVRDELAVQFDTRYARAAATLGALHDRMNHVLPAERHAAVLEHFAGRDIDDLAAMPPSEIEHEVERTADTVSGVKPADPRMLICASRASALAMTQTRMMMAKLAGSGIASTVLNITTKGDAVQDRSLAAIGGDSLFVKELELALRDERADYAVHSCKDLPSTLPDDMQLAAITQREDPRDAFCSEKYASFDDLPSGARVGTSSPRRRAQLHALRPDLTYVDIRGNVDTRLKKLRDGDYDAIVLASAGMRRLGVRATHTVPFAPHEIVPAVGQGALAIETRAGDPMAARIEAILGDSSTTIAVMAERAYLRTLRGGCQAPVGAHATFRDGEFHIVGVIAALDGSHVVRGERLAVLHDAGAAEAMAVDLARDLLARGGAAILDALAAADTTTSSVAPGPLAGRLVLLPYAPELANKIAPALRDVGAEVVEAADSDAARDALGGRRPSVILFPSPASVMAITEYLSTLRKNGERPLVAAMGPSSSASAGEHGFPPDVVEAGTDVASFVHTVTRYLLETRV
jgi:hydroxymethylbilane synthase